MIFSELRPKKPKLGLLELPTMGLEFVGTVPQDYISNVNQTVSKAGNIVLFRR